jgi:ring-1,2-phenylacetyl-CoA epoxidase subunit PaaD
MAFRDHPPLERVWSWLGHVPDPEIPVISVVDLGIVRDVAVEAGELVITITPTYSGCPATDVIAEDIERALRDRGLEAFRLETRISPPWTTDWISEAGRERLRDYGIAPPLRVEALLGRLGGAAVVVPCPRCGSENSTRVSEFGSTPCKAHYKCADCLEPFDYFKCL